MRFQNGTGCAGLSFSLSRDLLVAGGDGGGVWLVFVFFTPADPIAVDAPFLFAAAAAAALPASSASLLLFPLAAAGAPDDFSALVAKGCPGPGVADEAAANGSEAAFFANVASSRCDSLAACGAACCEVVVMRTWKAGKATARGGRRNYRATSGNQILIQASKGEARSTR